MTRPRFGKLVRTRRGPKSSIGCYLGSAVLFALSFAGTTPSLRQMGVAEIKPGMRGYGLSVFRGVTPERFDVEVIDVMHNFRPDQDLVLIKTPHPLLDHAGSVAGMSGSPVYIDDRLIGAYAYGWAFGKDPVAGVTPIASMLKELDRPLRAAPTWLGALPKIDKKKVARAPHRPRDAFYALSKWQERKPQGHPNLEPATTPLLVSGMPEAVSGALRERLRPLGLEVLEAAGSGRPAEGARESARFTDGGSIAVSLIRGDIQATAVGTVTHVDGKRLLAFGHPMLDAGESRLPTATSRVLHILASERSSFKIAEALTPLGSLVHDRQSAIVVDTSIRAETIPVRIKLHGLAPSARSEWNVEVANHRLLTASLVLSAMSSALGASANDATEMTYRANTVVTLRAHGPQRAVEEGFAPLGLAQPSSLARLRMFDVIDIAYGNVFEPAQIERIDVDLELTFERRVLELVGARLAEDELDPGQPARLVLALRPFAGPVEQRVIELPLPTTLAGEHVTIELLSGAQAQPEQPIPQTLDDLLEVARSGYSATSLVVNVQRKGRGLSLASHVIKNLPASAVDLLLPVRDSARVTPFVSEDRTIVPLGQVVVGQAKLSLDIRKEKR